MPLISKSHPGMLRLRNYFLTGFIVTAPLAITAYLAWSFVGWVDSWVKPLIPNRYNPDHYLPFAVPGFGLIVAIILITLVGFLTANFIGRSLVAYGEYLLDRMPLVRSVYRGLKQIFETIFADRAETFTTAALMEYPRRGTWAIVFIATARENEVTEAIRPHVDESVAVFLPSTPNPTTGFLLYVARSEIIELSMTLEEAAKLIISAGLVAPEYHKKTHELAVQAGAAAPVDPSDGDQGQPARNNRIASSRPNR